MFHDRANLTQLATVLDAVLDLDDVARDAWLEQHRIDAGLRREVLVLCRADGRPPGPLDAPVDQLATLLLGDIADHAGAMHDKCIGPWKIVNLLGEGGMATVWLAERRDGRFEQQVAIKCLKTSLAGPELAERFARERQILARLEHPGIARLLDGGVSDDGVPYIVMERISGTPLISACVKGRLALRQRLQLLAEVCRIVHYAHQNLVVHRDLKPANILIDDSGRPRLLDFGVAGMINDSSSHASATRSLALTPEYAAPEQLRGEPVGTAADVYSLGVIAFELVAGSRPAQAGSASTDQNRGPNPSRAIDDRRCRAAVQGDIDAIVSCALAPGPAARYSSAQVMSDDIQRYLGGLPVHARRAGATYRARKFVRRHWLGVALSCAGVLALCVALGFSMMQVRRAQSELARANAVQGFLLGVFDAAQPAPGGNFFMPRRELADRAIRLFDKQLVGHTDTGIDVLVAVGRLYRKLGFAERSRAVLERALKDIGALSRGSLDPRRITILLELGRANFLADDFSAASDQLAQADRLAETAGNDASTHAAILYELGASQSALRQIPEAMATLERGEKMARQDPESEYWLPGILLEQAVALRRANRMEAAIVQGRRSLDAQRRIFGSDDVRTAGALSTLGGMLQSIGQPTEAEKLLRQASAIETRAYGQSVPASVNNLAKVLQDRGELTESGVLFTRALELAGQRYGVDAVTTASYRRNLALQQADAGQFAAALINLRRAYARYADGHPLGSPGNLEMRAQLAQLLYEAGQRAEAEALLSEILADAPKHLDTASIPLRQANMLSARLALDHGDLSVAGKHLAAARADLGPYGMETTDQARLRLLAGDIAQAEGRLPLAHDEWRMAAELARDKLSSSHILAKAALRRLAQNQSPGVDAASHTEEE